MECEPPLDELTGYDPSMIIEPGTPQTPRDRKLSRLFHSLDNELPERTGGDPGFQYPNLGEYPTDEDVYELALKLRDNPDTRFVGLLCVPWSREDRYSYFEYGVGTDRESALAEMEQIMERGGYRPQVLIDLETGEVRRLSATLKVSEELAPELSGPLDDWTLDTYIEWQKEMV